MEFWSIGVLVNPSLLFHALLRHSNTPVLQFIPSPLHRPFFQAIGLIPEEILVPAAQKEM
jgi:hypothetical protein